MEGKENLDPKILSEIEKANPGLIDILKVLGIRHVINTKDTEDLDISSIFTNFWGGNSTFDILKYGIIDIYNGTVKLVEKSSLNFQKASNDYSLKAWNHLSFTDETIEKYELKEREMRERETRERETRERETRERETREDNIEESLIEKLRTAITFNGKISTERANLISKFLELCDEFDDEMLKDTIEEVIHKIIEE
jgi:hypothetical protein